MLLAALSVFLLHFAATKYWLLIVFSFIYGFSDGIFMTSAVYTQLTCVDAKRVTASFCTSNMFYSIAAAAGSPIAGELISVMSMNCAWIVQRTLFNRRLWKDKSIKNWQPIRATSNKL